MDIKDADAVNNRYNSEMAKDGLYSLFSAFLKNELDYRDYYKTLPDADAAAFLAREFTADDTSVPDAASGSVKRRVRPSGGSHPAQRRGCGHGEHGGGVFKRVPGRTARMSRRA